MLFWPFLQMAVREVNWPQLINGEVVIWTQLWPKSISLLHLLHYFASFVYECVSSLLNNISPCMRPWTLASERSGMLVEIQLPRQPPRPRECVILAESAFSHILRVMLTHSKVWVWLFLRNPEKARNTIAALYAFTNQLESSPTKPKQKLPFTFASSAANGRPPAWLPPGVQCTSKPSCFVIRWCLLEAPNPHINISKT